MEDRDRAARSLSLHQTSRRTSEASSVARLKVWALHHPILVVLVVAFVVRLISAIGVSAFVSADVFPDMAGYDSVASAVADGATLNEASQVLFERCTGFIAPLAALYKVFGDHLFLGQVLAAISGAATAVVITALLLQVSDPKRALVGGFIVALFPSHVLWSSVAYKDSTVWAVTGVMSLVVVLAWRSRGWRLAGLGLALAGLVFLLGHLRWPTMIVAGWALLPVAVLSPRPERIARAIGAFAIAVAIPWWIGAGPAGLRYVGSAGELREANSQLAETAFAEDAGSGFSADLTHLPRGLSVVLFEPVPGTSIDGRFVKLAQFELIVWYPLLILAGVGLVEVFRKGSALVFPVVFGTALLFTYALTEGNFGTAYRHRSELVPVLAVLAALGVGRVRRMTLHTQATANPASQT